jgi:3-hydroxyisobutyrate dehydrogenase
MTSQDQTIGFIGLGAMGMGMATSLIKVGFRVKGYDINPAALQVFSRAGGQAVTSIVGAARDVAALVIVVVNAEQVEEVLFGLDAAAEVLPSGSVVILCSTVKPEFARQTAARLYDMGLEMIDAPISGGAAKAAEGKLSIMASGFPAAFDKVDPILAAMSEKLYKLGDECGLGSTVKMVNQLLAGIHIAAAAEAIAFGVKAGANPAQLYEVISNSAGASWMFQNRVPHMLAGDFTPLSAVEIFVKDLGIVLETGKEIRFPLPLSAAAHQLYLMAAAAGLGREDDSAVVKIFEKLVGVEVQVKS